jgi:hypothetical protein
MAGETKKISPAKLARLRVDVLARTQDELGAAIGMSGGRVGTLEQVGGAMLLANFRRLAELAKMTPAELEVKIGEDGDEPVPLAYAKKLADELSADELLELAEELKKQAAKKTGVPTGKKRR